MGPPLRVGPGETLTFEARVSGEAEAEAAEGAVAETGNSEELVLACRTGDVSLVHELLRRRANVNSTNAKGKSSLHEAAKHGRSEVVRLLLLAGADLELVTNWKRSQMRALHYAARSGDLESVSLLLAAGADPAAATADGETAALLAQGNPKTQSVLDQALLATVRCLRPIPLNPRSSSHRPL